MGKIFGTVCAVAVMAVAVAVGIWGVTALDFVRTAENLLNENKRLEAALSNLTRESQMGFARVTRQEKVDGELMTTLKFVQTARDNPGQRIQEKTYQIRGDVVHFDALVVAFDPDLVGDGQARSLYLWRRVYGEHQAPIDGFPIETEGEAPARYDDLLSQLPLGEQELFWDSVWSLAHDTDKLREHGITAAYGSAVYQKLRPGFLYIFKIGDAGAFYPEVVPAL
jgi:hypothetical protein